MISEQSPIVGQAVASEILHFLLKLPLFSGSAMQKGHFAPICPHSHTGSLLQWSNNSICILTSLVQVRSNRCYQIRSINEHRPQNISWGSQIMSINSIVWPQTNQLSCIQQLLIILISQSSSVNLSLSSWSYFVSSKGGDAWRDIFYSSKVY